MLTHMHTRRTHAHTFTSIHAQEYAFTHIHSCTHIHRHTQKHTYTHRCTIYTQIHTHTLITHRCLVPVPCGGGHGCMEDRVTPCSRERGRALRWGTESAAPRCVHLGLELSPAGKEEAERGQARPGRRGRALLTLGSHWSVRLEAKRQPVSRRKGQGGSAEGGGLWPARGHAASCTCPCEGNERG